MRPSSPASPTTRGSPKFGSKSEIALSSGHEQDAYDRLEIVLRGLHDDVRWSAFESTLNQHTVQVYELPTAQVHVDNTSASAYTTVAGVTNRRSVR